MKIVSLILIAATLLCSCSSKKKEPFPIYGNHCGQIDNPSKVRAALPPVDMTDFACKNHNLCYGQKGRFSASCDASLISNLNRIIPHTKYEKEAIKSILKYFGRTKKLSLNESSSIVAS